MRSLAEILADVLLDLGTDMSGDALQSETAREEKGSGSHGGAGSQSSGNPREGEGCPADSTPGGQRAELRIVASNRMAVRSATRRATGIRLVVANTHG